MLRSAVDSAGLVSRTRSNVSAWKYCVRCPCQQPPPIIHSPWGRARQPSMIHDPSPSVHHPLQYVVTGPGCAQWPRAAEPRPRAGVSLQRLAMGKPGRQERWTMTAPRHPAAQRSGTGARETKLCGCGCAGGKQPAGRSRCWEQSSSPWLVPSICAEVVDATLAGKRTCLRGRVGAGLGLGIAVPPRSLPAERC